MSAMTYLVSSLTPEILEARRAQKTNAALAQARDALIGYALQYRDQKAAQDPQVLGVMYGYFPLPDLGSSRNSNAIDTDCYQKEGCQAYNYNFPDPALSDTVIGRFPWRSLGTGPLRDGHGECLWYAVSGSHQSIKLMTPMNWDTLGQLDYVKLDAGALVAEQVAAHSRPVAIIFSPGPALASRNTSTTDVVDECGGNYAVSNYLEATSLAPVFSSTNGASGDTSGQPKSLSTKGKLLSGEALLANDVGLPVTSDTLFGSLRKNAYFRTDINTMLERMVSCLRDSTIPVGYGYLPDSSCYNESQHPLGYYTHYKEMIFLSKPSGAFSVNTDSTCAAALFFAGQRSGSQQRSTPAQKGDIANYLEGNNSTGFAASTAAFAGEILFSASPPQPPEQDIVRCIPSSASITTVAPAVAATAGAIQLANYAPATRTLTLGSAAINSNYGASAAQLYACAWTPEVHDSGSGFRSYFRFRIRQVGEGFTFAVIDGDRNGSNVCGAARQHLGYSGNNGISPYIQWPKLAIEFDTLRNRDFSEPASLSNGRNDPCYLGSCGSSQNLSSNAHVAVVYWGYESSHAGTPTVTQVQEDDNVHGFPWPSNWTWPQTFPWPPSVPVQPATATRPAPWNPAPIMPYPINDTTSSNASSKSTIILANVAGYDDIYKQATIVVGSEIRTIVSYANATKTATVDTPFSSLVPASTPYTIYRQTGVAPLDRMGATSPAATASAKREFHARVEVTRSFTAPADAKDGATGIQVQVWIEPHQATNISAMTYNAGAPPTLTVTAASHGYATDDYVIIKDAVPAGFNGEYKITRLNADQFTAILPSGTPNPGPYISYISWADYSGEVDRATVTSADHGLNTGDSITIAGAIPTEYNGTRTITRIDANSYWFGLELAYEPGDMPPAIAAAKALTPRAIALANTTRPVSLLDSSFKPIISDTSTIYDELMSACAATAPRCPTSQSCGSNNMCYRPSFRNLRLGFTIGERVTSSTSTARGQLIEIKDQSTTWLQ